MQHFFIAGAIGIVATGVFACRASAKKKPKLELFDTHTCFFDPTHPEGVPWSGKGNKRLFRPTLPDEFKRVATKFFHGNSQTAFRWQNR